MTIRLRLIHFGLALLLGLSLSPARAWNAAGHRLIAAIAWDELSADTQTQVARLLDAHPYRADWVKHLSRGKTPEPITLHALFAEAATWADDIRRDARFTNNLADNSSVEASATDTARHRQRHYVNWTVDLSTKNHRESQQEGELDEALIQLRQVLRDPRRTTAERADALVWLIHLVGDAHQPLHVVSWRLTDGSIDNGGLSFAVHDAAHPRFSDQSLHSWWDDLPGPPWLRGRPLNERAHALRSQFSLHAGASLRLGEPADWLAESFSLARAGLRPHPHATTERWTITPDYRSLAKNISERRLVESGLRLGHLLNTTLAPQ